MIDQLKAILIQGKSLNEIQISNWLGLLNLAAGCYEMSGLAYLGIDIVIDKQRGPLVLELNARPGLAIQIANGTGMLPRLKYIEGLDRRRNTSIEDRVKYVVTHF